MITGISPDETMKYTCAGDKSDNPTIFNIGVMLNEDRLALMTKLVDSKGVPDMTKVGEQSFDIFKKGVKSVENFCFAKGKPPVAQTSDIDAVMQALPVSIIMEVALKAVEYNYLTDEEEKN